MRCKQNVVKFQPWFHRKLSRCVILVYENVRIDKISQKVHFFIFFLKKVGQSRTDLVCMTEMKIKCHHI